MSGSGEADAGGGGGAVAEGCSGAPPAPRGRVKNRQMLPGEGAARGGGGEAPWHKNSADAGGEGAVQAHRSSSAEAWALAGR
jgi:hypothetical protein